MNIINPMKYLVTTDSYAPFFTKWFEPENHFNDKDNMIVYDLMKQVFTIDGKTWHDIPIDQL